MGEGWENDVRAQSQLLLGGGVNGLQPEKQKKEQQAPEGPGKSATDRWGRIAKPICTRLMEGGLFPHQALLSKVQPASSDQIFLCTYVPPSKGPAFPGLTSSGPTSLRYV